MAERALERRSELFEERRSIASKYDTAKREGRNDAAKAYREHVERLDSEMNALAEEARDYVAEGERQEELRGAYQRGGALGRTSRSEDGTDHPAEGEWRGVLPSRSEMRIAVESDDASGGFLVPTGVRAQVIDLLRAKTPFLKALPAGNLVPFSSRDFVLPQITSSTPPGLVAEAATIPLGDTQFDGPSFRAKAYKALRKSSNEWLADTAEGLNGRNILADSMIRDCAVEFDSDLFTGDGVNTPVLGLLGQGTPVSVTGADASYDNIANAIEAIEGISGEASAIFASPDQAGALRREREGANGLYLGGAPGDTAKGTAWNLPRYVSANLPANTVAVVDMSRVFVGIRQNVIVRASEHAAFADDAVVWRLTMRAAGVLLAEAGSAQVITANAA